MEIPDPPAVGMCARCGWQKMVDRPCVRCGASANRPMPVNPFRVLEGLLVAALMLAFCVGCWFATIWLAIWFWSVV